MTERDAITEACLSVDYTTLLCFDELGARRVGVQRVLSESRDSYDLLVGGGKARPGDDAQLERYAGVDELSEQGDVPAMLAELIRYTRERNTRIAYGLGRSALLQEAEHQIWEMYEEPDMPIQIGAGQTIRGAFESAQLYVAVNSIGVE